MSSSALSTYFTVQLTIPSFEGSVSESTKHASSARFASQSPARSSADASIAALLEITRGATTGAPARTVGRARRGAAGASAGAFDAATGWSGTDAGSGTVDGGSSSPRTLS